MLMRDLTENPDVIMERWVRETKREAPWSGFYVKRTSSKQRFQTITPMKPKVKEEDGSMMVERGSTCSNKEAKSDV